MSAMKPTLLALFLGLIAVPSAGCGSLQADRCEAICNCENCGDRDLERCDIEVDAVFEVAASYGCEDALEPYIECQLNEYECDDGRYRDDQEGCRNEADQYDECLRAQSTRDPGPYRPID
jgi:hypothetical protein